MTESRYAQRTTVSPEASQAEITKLLKRYGADGFQYGWEANRAAVAFKAHGRLVRFMVQMPSADDPEFQRTETGLKRKAEPAKAAYEAEVRRRWRALALAIKAKLEVVATGIATFEDEFLAYTVLPDNTTVGDRVRSELVEIAATGAVPPRLVPLIEGGR